MFCSREKEIRQVFEYCKSGGPVVITSHPGMGATALLQDGVAPVLRKADFIVVTFGDWQGKAFRTRLAELIAKTVRAEADNTFIAHTENLSETLRRVFASTGKPLALLFDQFEDYLRCHASTSLSDTFDAEVATAMLSSDGRIVVALHDYALENFRRLEQYAPNPLKYHLTLGPLDEAGAKELIAGAGVAGGLEFEPAVTEALLKAPSVNYEGGYHPFYLMSGIDRIREAGVRKKWTRVSTGMIETYGSAERLIVESIDLKMSKLDPTQTDLFFRWCSLLLSPNDERIAVKAAALAEYSGRLNRIALTLLPVLVAEGVLRTIEISETLRYEIARESLVPLVRDWWRRHEAVLIARQRVQFRIRSLSLAVGLILAVYLVVYLAYMVLSLMRGQ